MPTIFDGTVFETYPFALPSVVVSVNCIIMFIVAYYWLPETLKSKVVQEAITRSTNLSGGGAHGGVQYSALLTTDGSDTDDRLGNESPTNDSGNSCDKNGSIELQRLKIGNGQLEDAVAKDESRNPLLTDINFENIAALEEGNKAAGGGATKKRVQKEQQQFLPLAVNGRGRLSGETETESVDSAFAPVTFSPHRKAAISPDQSRRSISFFSLVKVKVIDHPRISYQGLKQVGEDEAPLDGPVRQTLRASQPSASSPSPSDSQQQLVAGPLNAHLPDMSLRMQLQQEKEDNRNGIGNDDNELEENLLPSVRYSNGAEYFESVDSSKNLASNLAYLFKQRQVFVSTTLYGFGSFIVIIGNEVFTLWVVTSRADGGLNYNTQQIGTAIMFCGVIGTFLQLFLYPYAVDKLGVLKVHRWGAVLIALSSILIPNLPSMAGPDSPVLVLVLTVALLTLQALAATWYLVSTFVLISNSCYSHQLATVNGIGQTCASIGRLTGPYIGSVVFAWSETNGLAWPCNHYLVFYILAVLAAVSYQYSTLLPKSIQRRKREPKFRTWEDADAFYRLQEQQEQREQRAQQLEQQALHGQLEVQLRQKDTNREIRDNVTTGDQRPPANKFVANV